MKKIMLLLALCLVFDTVGIGQDDIYYTQQAKLHVNGKFKDQSLLGETRALTVRLDYETTEIILRFNLNSLEFNNDTINSILRKTNKEIVFNGEFSLEYINTEGHPPLDFEVEGWLDINNVKTKLVGKGQLYHVSDSGRLACLLSMTAVLNLKDLGIEMPAEIYEEVELVITQALLENNKN